MLRLPEDTSTSALRPQSQEPSCAAAMQLRPWANSAVQTPVRTSPMPPQAIPALPVELYEIWPPLSPMMVRAPLSRSVTGWRLVKCSTRARLVKMELSVQSRLISPGCGVSKRGPAHSGRIELPCIATMLSASASTTAGPSKSRIVCSTCCSLLRPKPGPIPSESAFKCSASRRSPSGRTMHSAGVIAQA